MVIRIHKYPCFKDYFVLVKEMKTVTKMTGSEL